MTYRSKLALSAGGAAAALLLSGCETAMYGTAPGGRYQLAEVDGRPVPAETAAGACRIVWEGGHLDIDPIARRFEIFADRSSSCQGGDPDLRENGSYLRSGSGLRLDVADPAGRSIERQAWHSGNSVRVDLGGNRLVFRQAAPPPRR